MEALQPWAAQAGFPALRPWRLRHAWKGPADHAALALCRAQLTAHGIELRDPEGGLPDAVKLHGGVLAEVARAGRLPLLDLASLAACEGWPEGLPDWLRAFMQQEARWHGVPMGIHRSNLCWLWPPVVHAFGLPDLRDIDALLRWLSSVQQRLPRPLAIGSEPWQVGLLFESLLLLEAGPQTYRQALVALQADALHGPAFGRALDALRALHDLAEPAALELDWLAQRERVVRGEAALQWMGDWSVALREAPLLEMPATRDCIAVADFIVPLVGPDEALGREAARALARPGHLRRFAEAKGCRPAAEARTAFQGAAVLPSLALEQCHGAVTTHALLQALRGHFLGRTSRAGTVAAILSAAAGRR